jgi:hypothetical protein
MTLPTHAPGSTWCECPSCGQGFGGVTLFDKHRVGEVGARRCLTAGEMAAKGWHQDGKGLWKAKAPATMPFPADTGGANRLRRTEGGTSGPRRRIEVAS